jgi:hypothetical protein
MHTYIHTYMSVSDGVFWKGLAGDARMKIAVAEGLHGALAYLPYDLVDEPLSIIHRINRAVPVRLPLQIVFMYVWRDVCM